MNFVNYDIGRFCFRYRQEVLHLTLVQFSKITRVPLKTISSFENGRSSNLNIMLKYVIQTDNQEEKEYFYENITNIVRSHEMLLRGFYK